MEIAAKISSFGEITASGDEFKQRIEVQAGGKSHAYVVTVSGVKDLEAARAFLEKGARAQAAALAVLHNLGGDKTTAIEFTATEIKRTRGEKGEKTYPLDTEKPDLNERLLAYIDSKRREERKQAALDILAGPRQGPASQEKEAAAVEKPRSTPYDKGREAAVKIEKATTGWGAWGAAAAAAGAVWLGSKMFGSSEEAPAEKVRAEPAKKRRRPRHIRSRSYGGREASEKSHSLEKPRGIPNVGNSCWIGSAAQVINADPRYRDKVFESLPQIAEPLNALLRNPAKERAESFREALFETKVMPSELDKDEENDPAPIFEQSCPFTLRKYRIENEGTVEKSGEDILGTLNVAIDESADFTDSVQKRFELYRIDNIENFDTFEGEPPEFLPVKLNRWKEDRTTKDGRVLTLPKDGRVAFTYGVGNEKRKAAYELVGVVEHVGDKMESGHYVAYVKRPKGSYYRASGSGGIVQKKAAWYKCDDASVTRAGNLETFGGKGYIFLLKRL